MTDCVRQGRGSRQEGLAGCGRQADTHGTQNKQQHPRRLILAKHYFAHVFRTPCAPKFGRPQVCVLFARPYVMTGEVG